MNIIGLFRISNIFKDFIHGIIRANYCTSGTEPLKKLLDLGKKGYYYAIIMQIKLRLDLLSTGFDLDLMVYDLYQISDCCPGTLIYAVYSVFPRPNVILVSNYELGLYDKS